MLATIADQRDRSGWKVELVPYDDQAKPDVGVSNAKNIIADKDIIGVIGHLNSGVAIPSSEVYKEVNLTMISPANTNPTVTDRGYKSIFRVCGRDDVQGVVGAEFAHGTLKAKSVYIVHDKTTYGQGVAEFFKADAEKKGLKVLGFEGTEEKSNFDPIITPIRAKNPDLIYFGGIYEQAAPFFKQAREKGVKSRFMGPDGMDSSDLTKIAGKAVVGMHYTSVAGPVSVYPQAKAFAEINGASAPFADALARQKVVSFGTPYLSRKWHLDHRPWNWSIATDCSIVAETAGEYYVKLLAGKKAAYAGGDQKDKPRVLAGLSPENPWYAECHDDFEKVIRDSGFNPQVRINYRLDINSMSNQAANVVARLKSEGATSIFCGCDPIFPVFLTTKAAEQNYNPEWVVVGVALDTVSQIESHLLTRSYEGFLKKGRIKGRR